MLPAWLANQYLYTRGEFHESTRYRLCFMLDGYGRGQYVGAFAEDHDGHQYVHHDEWKKGALGSKMRIGIAASASTIESDTCERRRNGYEWRQVDGNYVLAAVATGVIASVIVATATGH